MPDSASVTVSRPSSAWRLGIAGQQGVALRGGQDAGLFKPVRLLPGGHGFAGAGAEGAVNGGGVMAEPLQGGLQQLAFIARQGRFGARGPRPGFLQSGTMISGMISGSGSGRVARFRALARVQAATSGVSVTSGMRFGRGDFRAALVVSTGGTSRRRQTARRAGGNCGHRR